MIYLLGKTEDVVELEKQDPNRFYIFNPIKYSWGLNKMWLDMIMHKRIMIVSKDVSGTFKLELEYLTKKGRTNFEYLNGDIKRAIETVMYN